MAYRALRGVCIGPGRILAPGETAELDVATAQFLTSIGAVERVPDEPAPAVVERAPEPAPEVQMPPKGGKHKEK